jgi:hypothetical protein
MSDEKTNDKSVTFSTSARAESMPPFRYQCEGTGSTSIRFGDNAPQIDAEQRKKLRDALQNMTIS